MGHPDHGEGSCPGGDGDKADDVRKAVLRRGDGVVAAGGPGQSRTGLLGDDHLATLEQLRKRGGRGCRTEMKCQR